MLWLEDVHPHWYYNPIKERDGKDLSIRVLEPLTIRGKGRPKGALGSTKRLPSAFELLSSSAPTALNM